MKFYRLSDATFYDCINTIYQFIKPFLDNKISSFEEYGAFNKHYADLCLNSHRRTWVSGKYIKLLIVKTHCTDEYIKLLTIKTHCTHNSGNVSFSVDGYEELGNNKH